MTDLRAVPANPADLEKSTMAALNSIWDQHQVAARRQGLEFGLSLQQLKFAKLSPVPVGPLDTLELELIATRTAYCNKIREEYGAFERLVVDTRTKANQFDAAARELYQQNRPQAYQSLSNIVLEAGQQDLGQHGVMNQKLLQAQLEDDNADRARGMAELSQKIAAAYASHKYIIK